VKEFANNSFILKRRREKLKILREQVLASVALVLMLTMAVTLMAGVPTTFGQVPISTSAKIASGASCMQWPSPVGINQTFPLEAVIYPVPPTGTVYTNATFTITRPDGTKDIKNVTTDNLGIIRLNYSCNQLGTWSARLDWPGDATHAATFSGQQFGTASVTWTVQQQAVTIPGKIATYAYVTTTPTIIGLGQAVYIVGWTTPPAELFGAIRANYTFIITKPDGTTDALVYDSLSESTRSFGYVCNQEGTWSVKLSWAGDINYEGSVSTPATWTVLKDYVEPTIPSVPIPTGPWTYPISGEDYEWYQISGAWPQSSYNMSQSNFNPYSQGPNSPHVLWRLQESVSGLIGGEGGSSYYEFSPLTLVAAQGRLYYTRAESNSSSAVTHPVLYCLDQYTGKVIYRVDLPGTGSGGTPSIEISAKVKADVRTGVLIPQAFSLWLTSGGIWEIDPWTGSILYYWPGVSGTYHDGAIYMANFNGTKGAAETGTLTRWDTRLKAVVWTASIPSVSYYWNDVLVYQVMPTGERLSGFHITTWNATTGDLIVAGADLGIYSAEGRSIVGYGMLFKHFNDMRIRAVSLYTGKVVWTSEPMDAPWGTFAGYSISLGYGKVYFDSYDGHLYCYDANTGETVWKFFLGNTTETAMGHFGTFIQTIVADNKVYFCAAEHTPPNPIPRGGSMYCLDANTGDLIWSMGGFYGQGSRGSSFCGISSGILWYINEMDSYYFFGKGQTATTVSASPAIVTKGGSTLIQGTVTDQSPGAKGTPAVSDESMGAWMQYLYQQTPMPTNATGVTVHLQAMRSDGTVMDVTHVTTDIMGHYEYTWTPPAEDTYKILATFEGSNSYYTSSEQTGLGVTAAAPTPAAPAAAPDNTPMFIASTAAIIVAVAIVGVMLALILRKRP
jgi:outer membrane protein assembly factor BamB